MPNGTPAESRPMNKGTAEQEQKGVTMPRRAASTLPTPVRLPASRARALWCKEGLHDAHDEHNTRQQKQDLGCVEKEEVQRLAQGALARETGQTQDSIGEIREMLVSPEPDGGRQR